MIVDAGEKAATLADLEAIYGKPQETATVKVARHLTPEYRAWIEAAPFAALATVGPEGIDCSPRGDAGMVVEIVSDTRLAMPDRRGNNRIDSLRNIVRDPRVSLMFLIPGATNVIRVNGTGWVSTEPAMLETFRHDGALPRSVTLVDIREVYFQCSRAIIRADLWDARPDLSGLPSPGDILAALSEGRFGGPDYDRTWPERAAKTMY